jgi:hypothetical protein
MRYIVLVETSSLELVAIGSSTGRTLSKNAAQRLVARYREQFPTAVALPIGPPLPFEPKDEDERRVRNKFIRHLIPEI